MDKSLHNEMETEMLQDLCSRGWVRVLQRAGVSWMS